MGFTTCDLLNARRMSMTSFSSSSASSMVVFVIPLISAIPVLLETRVESGAVAVGFDADLAVHALHALLDDGEAYTRARVSLCAVQAFEHVEYPLPVLGGDTDPFVADADIHHTLPRDRPDAYLWRLAGRHELEGIAHEVEEYLL